MWRTRGGRSREIEAIREVLFIPWRRGNDKSSSCHFPSTRREDRVDTVQIYSVSQSRKREGGRGKMGRKDAWQMRIRTLEREEWQVGKRGERNLSVLEYLIVNFHRYVHGDRIRWSTVSRVTCHACRPDRASLRGVVRGSIFQWKRASLLFSRR